MAGQTRMSTKDFVMRLLVFLVAIAGLLSGVGVRAADDRATFFESKVRPILAARCHGCHGAKKQESSLRLDTKAGFAKGVQPVNCT